MRRFAAVATTAVLMLALADVASAQGVRIRPTAKHAERVVFSLSELRDKARAVASARLVVGRRSFIVRQATVRRAVRRGRIILRARTRGRRARLVVRLDRGRPTAPGVPAASPGADRVTLSWGAGRDDVRIGGYRILRDGRRVATVSARTLSYTDTGLTPASRYAYAVRSVDLVGNVSPAAEATAATLSTAAAAVPLTATGSSAPIGDLPGWRQIFVDDFTTNVPQGNFPAAVSDRWTAYPEGTGDTTGNGVWVPSRVISLHDGVMDLHLRTEGGQTLVAAPIPRLPAGQLYGRYAMRFRGDRLPGFQFTPLLWPDSQNWPADGEIDFPAGALDAAEICGFKLSLGGSGTDTERYCTPGTFDTWHTAELEWTPSSVRFVLDGQQIGLSTNRVPNTGHHWVLQVETDENSGAPSPATNGHVLIDWVAAWTPAR